MNRFMRSAAAIASILAVSLTGPAGAGAAPDATYSAPGVERAIASEGVITNLTPPKIFGNPAWGNVLTSDPGTWSPADDLNYVYMWTVDPESSMAKGWEPTLETTSAPIGQKLYLKVIVYGRINGEYAAGEAVSEPVVPTPARTKITATAPKVVKAHKKFVIHAHVIDPSGSLWGTSVTVSSGKRTQASTGMISPKGDYGTEMDVKIIVGNWNGRWLPVGTHTLKIRYSGMDPANSGPDSLPSSTTVKVKVTKRRTQQR